jgi:hypothetical protein
MIWSNSWAAYRDGFVTGGEFSAYVTANQTATSSCIPDRNVPMHRSVEQLEYPSFTNKYLRFHVLTASIKNTAFCDMVACSLVEVNRRFGGASHLHHALTMETVRTSEMSVYNNETSRRNIPEGSNLHIRYFSSS